MINLAEIYAISPIFLTVLLIVYLALAELGNKKVRESLFPMIISIIVAFAIIVIKDITSKW